MIWNSEDVYSTRKTHQSDDGPKEMRAVFSKSSSEDAYADSSLYQSVSMITLDQSSHEIVVYVRAERSKQQLQFVLSAPCQRWASKG